jgi:hypothetical protein
VTTAFDKPEFKIWTLDSKCDLQPHIMIKTSFSEGICFVLESSPTQLVCVDTNKSLNFYDFRHEQEKKDAEQKKLTLEYLTEAVTKGFTQLDTDRSGYLDLDELSPVCDEILVKYCSFYAALDDAAKESAKERLFDWIDADKSGRVSFREFKSSMIATWYEKIPAHILSPVDP